MQAFPILIISLKDAVPRRGKLCEALAKRGLEYSIIDAVDGRGGMTPQLASQMDAKACIRNLGRVLTSTEIGCALSHQKVYRHIVDKNHPAAIILEDDVELSQSFFEFCRQGTKLNTDCIIFYHSKGYVLNQKHHFVDTVDCYPIVVDPYYACGYWLSQRGAQYLIDSSLPLRNQADWPCLLGPLRPMATVPKMIRHRDEVVSYLSDSRTAMYEQQRKSPWNHILRQLVKFVRPSQWNRAIRKIRGIRIAKLERRLAFDSKR